MLRAKTELKGLPVGGAVVLECTDPLTLVDIPHFANQTGHELAGQERRGELYVFRIVKRAATRKRGARDAAGLPRS